MEVRVFGGFSDFDRNKRRAHRKPSGPANPRNGLRQKCAPRKRSRRPWVPQAPAAHVLQDNVHHRRRRPEPSNDPIDRTGTRGVTGTE